MYTLMFIWRALLEKSILVEKHFENSPSNSILTVYLWDQKRPKVGLDWPRFNN